MHPDEPSNRLSMAQLKSVWHHSVDLLQRGFVSGSIITTDGAAAKAGRRRYVYNQATCLCKARVKSWDIAQRRAYACLTCQPRVRASDGSVATGPSASGVKDVKVFPSHCAPDAPEQRLAAPAKMRVAELRKELKALGLDAAGGKLTLVARLSDALGGSGGDGDGVKVEDLGVEKSAGGVDLDVKMRVGTAHLPEPVSAAVAAAEKAALGESRAVEHVADVSDRTDLATATAKMKVMDLRAELRGRGLNTSGMKAVLAERLVAAVLGDGGRLTSASKGRIVKEEKGEAAVESEPTPREVPETSRDRKIKIEPRRAKRVAGGDAGPSAARRSSRRRKL